MSMIKKMKEELTLLLGREPTIHEEIDILILSQIKDRVLQLQLAYSVDPSDEIQEQYDHAVRCMKEVQDRNPQIFSFDDSDSDGDGYV
jgi:hypothetical protein